MECKPQYPSFWGLGGRWGLVLSACSLLVMGADHILPGTDYPFEDISVATEFQRSAPISAIDRAKIARLNAEKNPALP